MTTTTEHDEPPGQIPERTAALFRQHAARVYAYARRHVEESHCDDVVSETFLVAWRRPDQVPEEPLPWLLVVARNVIANQRRTNRRADDLWFAAVRQGWTATSPSADQSLIEREAMIGALESCTRAEREALLLTAWDGLTPEQAAAIADCSTRAFTVRLHRARTRLRAALAAQDLHSTEPIQTHHEPAEGSVRATTRLAQEMS
ncbi:RNA polymerase subunit sigma-24 [Knoellia sinensis KCTC 19936]|uniref:RNA polymerase subunit sigma-24 n=1 Tax=Knoellia sinensis KCTC 19936 TaxID=1385520 RepID=A0A0A0J7L4_9MICO|nr:RNA polymerase sigma factor [Knoellia sinensis]KGN33385.1 RNA polymerase subunit sigma-24 [Knoellia sinensis KCTC 19936]